jgi:hypothetical protein
MVFSISKMVVDLMGKTSPMGNCKTVYRWLNNLKTEPLKPPTGMIICGFDNNQVIGRTWSIKNQGNLPSRIATTVCR